MMICAVITASLVQVHAEAPGTPITRGEKTRGINLNTFLVSGGRHGHDDVGVSLFAHSNGGKAAPSNGDVLETCSEIIANIIQTDSSKTDFIKYCEIMVSNEIYDNPTMEISFHSERAQFIKDACDSASEDFHKIAVGATPKGVITMVKDALVERGSPIGQLSTQTHHLVDSECNRMRTRIIAFTDALKHRHYLENYKCNINATADNPTCSGNGICKGDGCMCNSEHTGIDCSIAVCEHDCGTHGFCLNGACACFEGWRGVSCTAVDCATDPATDKKCGPNGVCSAVKTVKGEAASEDRECLCSNGFTGKRCEQRLCRFGRGETGELAECSGRGFCSVDGKCTCLSGFVGPACDQCDPVTSHTICLPDEDCYCDEGFWGGCCNRRMCPNDCSRNGVCLSEGVCECKTGFTGADCSIAAKCPVNDRTKVMCSGVGICKPGKLGRKAKCVCPAGTSGPACQTTLCPFNNCLGGKHGECMQGKCVCHPGYDGIGCQKQLLVPTSCAQSCHHTCLATDCNTASVLANQDENLAREAMNRAKTTSKIGNEAAKDVRLTLRRHDSNDATAFLEVDSGKEFSCYYNCFIKCTQDKCFEQ